MTYLGQQPTLASFVLYESSGDYTGSGNVVSAPCFASGTQILTPRGEIAVEDLVVGDLVITSSGDQRPIRWLGHVTIDCRVHPEQRKAWPIRIAAHAFGDNLPHRDLYVSPDHSLCVDVVDAVLIPAGKLVNGSTIAQVEVDSVTYWHVELDSHDILWADGMPAESFLEMGVNRAPLGLASGDTAADNLSEEVLARTHADFCRPFHDAGPMLDIVRAQLTSRAERLGWTADCEPRLVVLADGQSLQPLITGGKAFVVVPDGVDELRLRSAMRVPAVFGEADDRRLGLAVYALTLTDDGGVAYPLDMDDPLLRNSFHEGERLQRQHYRWTRDDLVIPRAIMAGLPGSLMLKVSFELSTIRGWIEPEHRPQRPMLRIVV